MMEKITNDGASYSLLFTRYYFYYYDYSGDQINNETCRVGSAHREDGHLGDLGVDGRIIKK
jgi:hypothetical protein